MKVALKELRETSINLKILKKAAICDNEKLLDECRQLIAIFTKSIDTAQSD
jgi:hypothetical protein